MVTPRIVALSALLLPSLVMAESFEGLTDPGPIIGTLRVFIDFMVELFASTTADMTGRKRR